MSVRNRSDIDSQLCNSNATSTHFLGSAQRSWMSLTSNASAVTGNVGVAASIPAGGRRTIADAAPVTRPVPSRDNTMVDVTTTDQRFQQHGHSSNRVPISSGPVIGEQVDIEDTGVRPRTFPDCSTGSVSGLSDAHLNANDPNSRLEPPTLRQLPPARSMSQCSSQQIQPDLISPNPRSHIPPSDTIQPSALSRPFGSHQSSTSATETSSSSSILKRPPDQPNTKLPPVSRGSHSLKDLRFSESASVPEPVSRTSIQGQQTGPTPMSPPSVQSRTDPLPPKVNSAQQYRPQLDAILAALQCRQENNVVTNARYRLCADACHNNDLFFLILHQLFCLYDLQRPWMIDKLGFGQQEKEGFECLSPLLMPNQVLSHTALVHFSNFPIPTSDFENEQVLLYWVGGVMKILRGLPGRWSTLKQRCFQRRGLPCSHEIAFHIGCWATPILERVFFASIRRSMWPKMSPRLESKISELFETDQERLRQRIRQGSLTPECLQSDIETFFNSYLGLTTSRRESFTSFLPSGSMASSIPPPVMLQASGGHPPYQQASTSVIQNNTTTSPIASTASVPLRGAEQQSRQIFQFTNDPNVPLITPNSSNHINRPSPASNYIPMSRIQNQSPSSSTGPPPPQTEPQTRRTMLMPPANFRLPTLVNPEPDISALHQAYLRSPQVVPRACPGDPAPSFRKYLYLESFVLSPQVIEASCPFSCWPFNLSETLIQRKVHDFVPPTGDLWGERTRNLDHGSILVSLRCIILDADQSTVDESAWSASPTYWPDCGFFSINGEFVEVRRKMHHRKDLSADITNLIHQGVNTLKFASIPSAKETGKKFAIAVEIINVADHDWALDIPLRIDSETSFESIISSFEPYSIAEDVRILQEYLTIDMVDPFTSQIFEIPVRGKACLHKECFDLKSFLESRTSRGKNGVVGADEWLCPICRKDARPTSLVIDGFLLRVRDKLTKEDNTNIKAVLVYRNGAWQAKIDKPTHMISTSMDQTGPPQSRTSSSNVGEIEEQGRQRTNSSLIIDLDDD